MLDDQICILQELFSDATIACDGHFYPVHKLVLSTCSEYFAGMFERTPCKHPIIVLKDVGHKDVDFLLSYMYGGEVSVAQADLPNLIRAAETLRIKGLAAPDEPPPDESPGLINDKENDKSKDEERRRRPRAKRQRTSYSSGSSAPCSDNNDDDAKPIKTEIPPTPDARAADTESTGTVEEQDIGLLTQTHTISNSVTQMYDDTNPLEVIFIIFSFFKKCLYSNIKILSTYYACYIL